MKPLHGDAPEGQCFNPKESADDSEETTTKPKPAPAPGVPVSEEKYERMKEAARHAPAPRAKEAQEDRPRKKDKP